jgi:hypothetical protein
MGYQGRRARIFGLLLLAMALGVFGFAGSAFAHEGEYAKFNNCPSTNAETFKCISSVTEGGEVVLGNKRVPIVNPAILQGGFTKPNKETHISNFLGATNGETLSRAPQPVPGGLAGLVNCNEISNSIVRALCRAAFENGLTGVNATLELARPASEIKISEFHLVGEEAVALELPVKIHLENPFLGSSCYVGSSSSPLAWKLTTGETSPPPPNLAIHGFAGESEFRDEGRILQLNDSELVDNAWSAPAASGCGGPIIELLIDPIVDLQVGLPAAAGHNAAVLVATTDVATAKAVNEH